jgi:hypothetical protein
MAYDPVLGLILFIMLVSVACIIISVCVCMVHKNSPNWALAILAVSATVGGIAFVFSLVRVVVWKQKESAEYSIVLFREKALIVSDSVTWEITDIPTYKKLAEKPEILIEYGINLYNRPCGVWRYKILPLDKSRQG